MDKIYLIIAHKSPKQLERQILKLSENHSFFYVHIDSKTDIRLFNHLELIKNVVLIKERENCIWGDFSQVKATLNLIKNVLKYHNEGFCVLMSGNDYPIKSSAHINEFIEKNSNKIFINYDNNGYEWIKDRIEKYRININAERGNFIFLQGLNKKTIKAYLEKRITAKQLFLIGFIKRKLNIDMKFYGGSNWWAMNIQNLKTVNNYITHNKKYLFNFFVYSHCCDEIFFHSIIMHIKELLLPFELERSLTYDNWNRKNCPLPVTFKKEDLKELQEQPDNKLFARKFDINIDTQILDDIDKSIN